MAVAGAKGVVVCIIIVIIDIAAGVLGIQAESAQNKEKHVRLFIFECKKPSHEAYKLSLAAAALLALSHAVANLVGGWICVCSKDELDRSSPNRQLSVSALILSWIVAAVAFALLMIGVMNNKKSRTSCGFAHHHFMSIGGILCFVHGFLCVVYYLSAQASRREDERFMTTMAPRGGAGGNNQQNQV